jgi:hypothetical protein
MDCRPSTTECKIWFNDKTANPAAPTCIGCENGRKQNGNDCLAAGTGLEIANCFYTRTEVGTTGWTKTHCTKCATNYYWDGDFCVRSKDYEGGIASLGPKEISDKGCNFWGGWSTRGKTLGTDPIETCRKPGNWLVPAAPANIKNYCTPGKCVSCRRIGDHYSCEACYDSHLVQAQIIDGNKFHQCAGSSTNTENCKVLWAEHYKEQFSGCRVCSSEYIPQGSGTNPIHYTCVPGTTANCEIYKMTSPGTITCRICNINHYRKDGTNTCEPIPNNNMKLDKCLAYKEVPNTNPVQIVCELCSKDYGVKANGRCATN